MTVLQPPEPQPPAKTAPETPAAPVVEPADSKPILPSFMHRPAARKPAPETPVTPPKPAPEPVAAIRPGIVDAPDPPADDDLPYTPGPLAHLAGLRSLTPDQARAIAPLARQLRDHITHTGTL